MAWAILVARWRITVTHTVLILLLGITLALTCAQASNPLDWTLALAPFLVSAIAIYIYNIRNRTIPGQRQRDVKRIIAMYLGFLLISAIASAWLWNSPSLIALHGWGCVYVVLGSVGLWVQHNQMNEERKERKIP